MWSIISPPRYVCTQSPCARHEFPWLCINPRYIYKCPPLSQFRGFHISCGIHTPGKFIWISLFCGVSVSPVLGYFPLKGSLLSTSVRAIYYLISLCSKSSITICFGPHLLWLSKLLLVRKPIPYWAGALTERRKEPNHLAPHVCDFHRLFVSATCPAGRIVATHCVTIHAPA